MIRAPKIRVLLVEDNPTDALIVREELAATTSASFEIVHLEELSQAVSATVDQQFDIVLLDLSLPDSHGFETFARLHDAVPGTPIVVLSGGVDEELAVRAVHAGAQDYLVKGRMGEEVLPRSIRYAIERQRTERVLAESEERHRLLIERSPDGYLVHCDGKVVFANPAALKLYGAQHDRDVLGTAILDFVAPEFREHISERALLVDEEGSNPPLELDCLRLDGTRIALEATSHPFSFQGRQAVQVVLHNLTERNRAMEKLREQAALLDHAQDAIFVHDLHGCLHYWNKSAERILGWTAQEAIGAFVQDLFYDRRDTYERHLQVVLRDGDWMGETQARTKSGGEATLESRWTLLRTEEGAPKSILVIKTDVTEARKMEAQLFRAQRMDNIGALAAGIAHDLNNVLGPVLMGVDLLRHDVTNPRDIELLDIMEASGKRGAAMVKQVLSFARGLEGQRSLVSPVRLVHELAAVMRDTFPKGIQVDIDAPEGTWSTLGDATQLHQVLLNLCINARDAMPNGGHLSVRLHNNLVDQQFVAMHPDARPGPYVVLEVADTGDGIAPGLLAKIFEPFFTTKPVGKGTGLGLSTTQAIVKSHGGYITVESTLAEGTTFQVNLPAETGHALPQSSVVLSPLPHGAGQMILLIEDEAAIRSITAQTLEAYGYHVMSASDGAEGIALYAPHATEIAAVITDMMMPVMEGAPTIRILKRLNPDVKIIVSSGSTAKGLEAEVRALGVKHFMPKPYTADTMLRMLDELLRDVVA